MAVLVDADRAELLLLETMLRLQAGAPSPAEASPQSPLAWALQHRRIDGQPFSLDRFAPLQALYADNHPHIVVMKPAQRGVSEWAINYTAFALDRGASAWETGKDGLNIAYVFPTEAALGDFSKERFSGLRRETDYLAQLFGGADFDAVRFKQVRTSYLYLRGGQSESALLSFAADVLILDEFDRMDPKAVALARRRLNASVVQREVNLSTPTLPGVGIHALYLQSDQRVYEQSCPWCTAWQQWDFFRDVRADGVAYAAEPGAPQWRTWPAEQLRQADIRLTCPACQYALTDAERCTPGRWTAQQPDVTSLRGYHIPWAPWPFLSLTKLAVVAISQNPSEVQELYRSDLGLPYEAGGSRVTAEMLAQLSHELPGGLLPDVLWRDTTMGVDVGSRYHYRVTSIGPDAAVYVRAMGAAASWEDLDGLLARYRVRQCVVDALPELHGAADWAARHPGQVLRALYPQENALAGQLYRVDLDKGLVHINRTMAMDRVYAAIANGEERWPAVIHNDPEVRVHLTAPVRVTVQDSRGQERATWVHTAPDHLFHSAVYDQIARATLPAAPRPFTAAAGGQRSMGQEYQPR